MKKLISIICILTMALTVLASCNDHEHKFATDKLVSDSDYHWHPCEAKDGCKEKGSKAEHTFEASVDKDGNAVNKCAVCGATNEKVNTAPEHECAFADTYQYSENFHWYPCTQEGCYEMSGKAEHAYGNPEVTYGDGKIITKYTCVDCGCEKTTEEKVDTVVDSAVAWNEMFKNFKFTNFTMDVFFTAENYSRNNHCVVTENSAYYHIGGGREFYTVKNEDGTCTTYYRYDDKFTRLDDTTDEYLVGAQTETVIQVSFEENFDKFTYDAASASYVCKEEITCQYYDFDGTLNEEPLKCYDSVVKIVDGKISYISAKYYIGDTKPESGESSFIYYNIGISAVTIPQDVIDGKVISNVEPEN